MRPLRLLVVLAAASLACALLQPERASLRAPDPESHREIDAGQVVGFTTEEGSHAWLGLPYASPPVGERRWRNPDPPAPWSGIREALTIGSACSQYPSDLGGVAGRAGRVGGDEDCLYLNVWAPRFSRGAVPGPGARRPVMVWIHGGSNLTGHGGFYDGSRLAARHGVVVVTINYRLGPLGWFRHPALTGADAGDLDRSGNFGTLDQIAALRWVQRNAAALGGDPANVTVFGESAGGTNVLMLLVSPESRRLFHRAIIQSGGSRTFSPLEASGFEEEGGHPDSAQEVLARLLIREGLARDRAGARARIASMSEASVARYLRARTPDELFAAYRARDDEGLVRMPRLFRDGVVLPEEDPLELLRAGGHHAVPTMLGTTRDEAKLWLFFDPDWVRRLLWIFPRVRDRVRYQLTAEYRSRVWKATGADGPAELLSGTQTPGVWVYRFDWDEEPTVLGADLAFLLGAAHAFEIPFVFGDFDLGGQSDRLFTEANRPGREVLSAHMMSYWAQFAWSGDPGRGRDGASPTWLRWREGGGAPGFLVLDTPADGGVRRSGEFVTKASLVADVRHDPRLPSAEARCALLADLDAWSYRFQADDYRGSGCRALAAR